ncbi:MAG TPA: ABC transporter ATP-binding protein [Methylibium sp.]|nr:ABC transporter ATP-binding protein [Methylibium sp.]
MRPWHDAIGLQATGLALHAGAQASARRLATGLGFEIRGGERWVVLGPNGAGKSTLIATLAGLLPPTGGALALQGVALADWRPDALARWRAWCPQFWSDPFPARVDETVRAARRGDAADAGTAFDALLAALDLAPLAATDVRRLSGGERQRVALAAALWQDAPLLLLDEPTSHLDLAHQQQLVVALGAHASRGGAVCASLHDVQLAWQLATHAVLLDGRGGAAAGPREAVMTPARLSAAYGVTIDRVEVCGEQRFWIGPRREGMS